MYVVLFDKLNLDGEICWDLVPLLFTIFFLGKNWFCRHFSDSSWWQRCKLWSDCLLESYSGSESKEVHSNLGNVMWRSQKSNKTENTLSRFLASSITLGCSGQNICHSGTRWRCQGKQSIELARWSQAKLYGARQSKALFLEFGEPNFGSNHLYAYRWVHA